MSSISLQPLIKPVNAMVETPGSKSYTNRALLMAAMTRGPVRITGALLSDDTEAMIHCLQTLGVEIVRAHDTIDVLNDLSAVKNQSYDLNARLSGVTIRFLLALACTIPGIQTLYGHEGLNKRPIADLVDGLRQLGAHIEYLEREGFPPLRVSSSHLQSGVVNMNGNVSSQYFSALLMAAPRVINGNLTIRISGRQISKPYIDMTMDTMRKFGVDAVNHDYREYIVSAGQHYHAQNYRVEGDISSASYFFAIAALTQSTITVCNVNPNSKQADMQFLNILEMMGNKISRGMDSITVIGTDVKPVSVDMENCPDQAMTMAVLAAFAPGVTVLKGVQSLRVKETERVAAVETELAKMGIQTHSTHDTLTIHGGAPHAAAIDTYGDHRMAMAFAVAGARLQGMVIHDPAVVGKTFPKFWETLANIANNIVLIGMRGSGKTTTGKLLAQRLGKTFVDMDALIVQKAGMNVREIVAQHGWPYFRDCESATAVEAGNIANAVIATGGGALQRPENILALKKKGIFIWLKADPQTLSRRIENSTERPPLTQHSTLPAELQEVWEKYKTAYEQTADLVIHTDRHSPAAAVEEIENYLASAG